MRPVGDHHAEQIRQVHQVLEGVEDGSDSLASNMIKRESPQEYDLGEQLPHLNNQGSCSLAQDVRMRKDVKVGTSGMTTAETMGWRPTWRTDQHTSQVVRRT